MPSPSVDRRFGARLGDSEDPQPLSPELFDVLIERATRRRVETHRRSVAAPGFGERQHHLGRTLHRGPAPALGICAEHCVISTSRLERDLFAPFPCAEALVFPDTNGGRAGHDGLVGRVREHVVAVEERRGTQRGREHEAAAAVNIRPAPRARRRRPGRGRSRRGSACRSCRSRSGRHGRGLRARADCAPARCATPGGGPPRPA